MKQLTLNASTRTESGSAASRRLRHEGKVPAIAYGQSNEPSNLCVDAAELSRTLRKIGNNTPIVQLAQDGGETKASIIKDVQRHPITDNYIHVDFQQVGDDELIAVTVPVHPKGEADGVKNEGGTLEFVLHAVHVRCLLKDVPEFIESDVSALKVGDTLHIKQLPVVEGVSYLDHPEQPVFSVAK